MKLSLGAGVLFGLFMVSRPAMAVGFAPIDCAKAVSAADRLICSDYALGQSEARVAALYGVAMALFAMGQRGDLGDQQIAWLGSREACGASISCLRDVYRRRIRQLNDAFSQLSRRGPF